MLPTLWPGDVVEIEGSSLKDVRPGDIVLALRGGRLFLHRLVSYGSLDGFVLRGDSMPASDPVFPADALLGRLARVPGEGHNDTASTLRAGFGIGFGVRWARALGVLLCHSGVARRLALKLQSRRKPSQRVSQSLDLASDLTFAERGGS